MISASNLDDTESSVFCRFGDGSSGVDGLEIGDDAAARCMNFMVRSFDDIVLGAFAGELVARDILSKYCGSAGLLVQQ